MERTYARCKSALEKINNGKIYFSFLKLEVLLLGLSKVMGITSFVVDWVFAVKFWCKGSNFLLTSSHFVFASSGSHTCFQATQRFFQRSSPIRSAICQQFVSDLSPSSSASTFISPLQPFFPFCSLNLFLFSPLTFCFFCLNALTWNFVLVVVALA